MDADEMMRILNPTTVFEQRETIAVLGNDVAFRLLGIKDDEYVEEVSEPLEPQYDIEPEKSYKRQERLEAFLKIVRNETFFVPSDRHLDLTIKFCFGELFMLFDTKFNLSGQRQNFLSYGYFINRILELHGRFQLRDKLKIKEPKTPRIRKNNAKLWQMFLEDIQA